MPDADVHRSVLPTWAAEKGAGDPSVHSNAAGLPLEPLPLQVVHRDRQALRSYPREFPDVRLSGRG
jgi:hypothetical protein